MESKPRMYVCIYDLNPVYPNILQPLAFCSQSIFIIWYPAVQALTFQFHGSFKQALVFICLFAYILPTFQGCHLQEALLDCCSA